MRAGIFRVHTSLFIRSSLADERDLKIGWAVPLRVEAAAINVPRPQNNIPWVRNTRSYSMKFFTGGEAERGECLAEHALRLANLPLRVVLNGGPVQDISEGPREAA